MLLEKRTESILAAMRKNLEFFDRVKSSEDIGVLQQLLKAFNQITFQEEGDSSPKTLSLSEYLIELDDVPLLKEYNAALNVITAKEAAAREAGTEVVPLVMESSSPSPSSLSQKPKAILIAVSAAGGYGDLLFALKLSEQLKKHYADCGQEKPPVYLVSNDVDKAKILALKGDKEFEVEVLTPDGLAERVNKKQIDVGTVIEGPFFNEYLMGLINAALTNIEGKVPLIMVPEYGYNSEEHRQFIADAERIRNGRYEHLSYAKTIYSGFKQEADETGILVSDMLVHKQSADKLVGQLDDIIHRALLGKGTFSSYKDSTQLSMQYSHDSVYLSQADGYRTDFKQAAHCFLNIHREFSKGSKKNQDVIMIGSKEYQKLGALREIKDKLIADGYQRIVFFDAETGKEDVLHDSDEKGRTYRVIYTSKMTHPSMIACTALSGPLMGATGDQSLGEACCANKLIVYECLSHKANFIQDYDAALQKIYPDDSEIVTLLSLLRNNNLSDPEYEELGKLLTNPENQRKLREGNTALLKKSDLVASIVQADEAWELQQRKHIVSLLKEGRQREAATYLVMFRNRISVTDVFEGRRLLDYAIDNDPKGVFSQYCSHSAPVLLDKFMPADHLITDKLKPVIINLIKKNILPISKEIVQIQEPALDDSKKLDSASGFYKLGETIGIGGWGVVYKAQYYLKNGDGSSSSVAIKELTSSSASSDRELYCFRQAYPEHHFEQFKLRGKTYLAMPLFEGVQLNNYLSLHPELPKETRQLMAIELLTDLSRMHERKVTHNDLKPQNILFNPVTQKMHIIDFGCAEDITKATFMKYNNINDAVFAFEFPPEYLTGTAANTSLDVYSITPILAEVLGVSKKELVTARLNKALEGLSEDLSVRIKAAFEKHPTLEEVLLDEELFSSPGIKDFVKQYVAVPYDFSPYEELLGSATISLLNKMQAKEAKDRPATAECLSQLKEALSIVAVDTVAEGAGVPVEGNPASVYRAQLQAARQKALGDGKEQDPPGLGLSE